MFLEKRANVYLCKLGFFFIAVFQAIDRSFILLYPNKILLRNPCQWRLLDTNLRIFFQKFQLFSISWLKSEPVMLDFANESLFWANISNRFAKTMKFFTIQFWTVHLCIFFTAKECWKWIFTCSSCKCPLSFSMMKQLYCNVYLMKMYLRKCKCGCTFEYW